MKIYGNSTSDGFPLFMAAIGGLFVVGSWMMVALSGLALLGALAAFAGLVALMLVAVRRWDVMSELVEAKKPAVVHDARGTFPVAAASDTATAPTKAAWSGNATTLPMPVDNPKPAVETNALAV